MQLAFTYRHKLSLAVWLTSFLPGACLLAADAGIDPARLPGIVVDNEAATVSGTWSKSVHTKPYLAAGYIYAQGGPDQRVTFELNVPEAGEYSVLVSYTMGDNRASDAPVIIETANGPQTVIIDQKKRPQGVYSFHDLGQFTLPAGKVKVVISAEQNKQGVVIADGVMLLTGAQKEKALADAAKGPPPLLAAIANAPNAPKAAPPAPAIEKAPAFVREDYTKVVAQPHLNKPERLTPGQADRLLAKELGRDAISVEISDEAFLRRVTLDLVGRQPTVAEAEDFAASQDPDKRERVTDKLLASEQFASNWGSYVSDIISYRTPQPELTFLNYRPFQEWLAKQIRSSKGWDEITYEILTASGKVGDNPAATYVGFHQGDKSRLAAETTRVFLATQIQCAECHDHKFVDMPQETFHHVAAFFVRVDAKLPHNDSNQIVVSSRPAGEHKMPEGKEEMKPMAFSSKQGELGQADMTRRVLLANWIVAPENPWFAKAMTNRIWARTMGRGFCEPVDEIGELGDRIAPDLHAAVAAHFVASQYDLRDFFRLVTSTAAYQRAIRDASKDEVRPFEVVGSGRLRGEEVFESLATGIDLPNYTPPPEKPNDVVRFPPPPKSTRDLVNEAFGFDPSAEMSNVVRTMQQAMFLMNNEQIQRQIDARPESGTMLAKLLQAEANDDVVTQHLYQSVLARKPTAAELAVAKEHRLAVGDRNAAFEDLLWSLINGAEFVSRR